MILVSGTCGWAHKVIQKVFIEVTDEGNWGPFFSRFFPERVGLSHFHVDFTLQTRTLHPPFIDSLFVRSTRCVCYLFLAACCPSSGRWTPGSVRSGCNPSCWSTAPPPAPAPSYTGLHPSPLTSSNPHRTLTSSQPMTAQPSPPSPPSPIGRRLGKHSFGLSTFYKVRAESD